MPMNSMLVRSSVNQGPFVGEFQAPLRQGSGATVQLGWYWANQHSTFAAQVQQLLGEDCKPDAEFESESSLVRQTVTNRMMGINRAYNVLSVTG
jgi:hypothetical protein